APKRWSPRAAQRCPTATAPPPSSAAAQDADESATLGCHAGQPSVCQMWAWADHSSATLDRPPALYDRRVRERPALEPFGGDDRARGNRGIRVQALRLYRALHIECGRDSGRPNRGCRDPQQRPDTVSIDDGASTRSPATLASTLT